MPRKSGVKASVKVEQIAADGSHILNSTIAAAGGGATRGTTGTRGAKRRRNLNNVNSGSTENYGSGTIVAANPFDDDDHIPTLHHQPPQSPLTMSGAGPIRTGSNKMMIIPTHHQQQQPLHHLQQHPPLPPHHIIPQQHHHHQHHPQQHQSPHPPAPHPHQMHPIYSPNNYMQQPPPHPHSHMSTPPGQMATGPPPPPPQQIQQPHQMQDHLIGGGPGQQQPSQPPTHQQHPYIHQQQQPPQPPQMQDHLIGGVGQPHPPNQQNLHQQHQPGLQPPPQMQDHLIGPGQQLAPHQHQQQMMTGGPSPGQQNFGPPPQHLHQQQQTYGAMNQNIYCGKCQREIYQNEPNMICKAGCRSYFHISCSGLTQLACDLLMKESSAEWACDRCTSGNRRVPFVKYRVSQNCI